MNEQGCVAASPPADVMLDCLGLTCPVPMMEAARQIRELAPGQVLLLLSDDPATHDDMVAWCHLTGHEFLGAEPVDGYARLRVRKQVGGPRRVRNASVPDQLTER